MLFLHLVPFSDFFVELDQDGYPSYRDKYPCRYADTEQKQLFQTVIGLCHSGDHEDQDKNRDQSIVIGIPVINVFFVYFVHILKRI